MRLARRRNDARGHHLLAVWQGARVRRDLEALAGEGVEVGDVGGDRVAVECRAQGGLLICGHCIPGRTDRGLQDCWQVEHGVDNGC